MKWPSISKDGLLLVANNADTPPFVTLIAVGAKCGMVIKKKITYSFATNGAEQPVWDPTNRPVLPIDPIDVRNHRGARPDRSDRRDQSDHRGR